METETEPQTRTETVSIYTIYTMLNVDPTRTGAAESVRRKSLGILGVLQQSPAHIDAVIRAAEAARKYEALTRAISQ